MSENEPPTIEYLVSEVDYYINKGDLGAARDLAIELAHRLALAAL